MSPSRSSACGPGQWPSSRSCHRNGGTCGRTATVQVRRRSNVMGSCALAGARIMHLSVCWGCVGVSTETWWPSPPESWRMVLLLDPSALTTTGNSARARDLGHIAEAVSTSPPTPFTERGSPAPRDRCCGIEKAVVDEQPGRGCDGHLGDREGDVATHGRGRLLVFETIDAAAPMSRYVTF